MDKPPKSHIFNVFADFWPRGPWPMGPLGTGPWPRGARGPLGPWPLGRLALGPLGPWVKGPWALGPRAQGVLVLKTGEAHRPKCAFPRPLVVAIVVVAV